MKKRYRCDLILTQRNSYLRQVRERAVDQMKKFSPYIQMRMKTCLDSNIEKFLDIEYIKEEDPKIDQILQFGYTHDQLRQFRESDKKIADYY